MATFTATANTATTIRWTRYGQASWREGAAQGVYDDTRNFKAEDRRVGVMVFTDAGNTLKSTRISKIELKLVFSTAGYSDRTKTLYLRKSNHQSIDESLNGSRYIGDLLGTVSGKFSGETATFTLDADNNTELFLNLQKYFRAGNSTVVVFDESLDHAQYGADYTYNYLRVLEAVITVTYENATFLWRWNGSAWEECEVWCCVNGVWIQCIPYYRKDGVWIQV